MIVIGIVGLFVGTLLIIGLLDEGILQSFSQSLGATLIALILVAFLQWIGDIGTVTTVLVFALLYGILLWIMRFRMVSDLFVDTVRVIRVMVILGIVIGLVVWIVL